MHRIKKNKLTFLLLMPVFIFYTGYFFNYAPGYKPTGFIQYDNISYVAYAKQYIDHPGKSIGYSNPLSDSGDYPAIYFQTQTLMLAGLLKMGIDPGIAICIFSILFASWQYEQPFQFMMNYIRMVFIELKQLYYLFGVEESFHCLACY